jgi:hypothetical protein
MERQLPCYFNHFSVRPPCLATLSDSTPISSSYYIMLLTNCLSTLLESVKKENRRASEREKQNIWIQMKEM